MFFHSFLFDLRELFYYQPTVPVRGILCRHRTGVLRRRGPAGCPAGIQPDINCLAPVLEGKAQYGVGNSGLLRLRQQGEPVVVLAKIFQHLPSVLITLRESNIFSVDEHPERADKMIRATLKGWAYALEHKDDIFDLILTKYNPDLNRDQLRYEAKVIDQLIVPDLVPIGDINPKRYKRIAETYHRHGVGPSSPSPKQAAIRRR